MNTQISKSPKMVFVVLFIYSFLPGFAKILDYKEIFLFNIPLIIYFTLMSRLKWSIITLATLFYVLFSLFYSSFLMSLELNNVDSTITSFYIYLLPFIGVISFRGVNHVDFLRILSFIALAHAILGFIIFGFYEIPAPFNTISNKLLEGVFPFRMASVSGSIGFGALCTMGFISSIYLSRHFQCFTYKAVALILFFAVIFSQQRSAWIVTFLFLIWHFSQSFFKSLPFLIFLAISSSLAIIFLQDIDSRLIDFLIDRFTGSVTDDGDLNIVSERSHMWTRAFKTFLSNGFGIGLGQGGYVAQTLGVNLDKVVTDGDYFRILQESGIVGLLYFLLLISSIVKKFVITSNQDLKYMLWIPIATLIQMIGSNLTEFYFTNYLFWISVGMSLQINSKQNAKL